MTEYSILLISSIIVPLIFSFEKQIFFIKKIKQVLLSIVIVAIPYLIWDEIFTQNKIWGFSEGRVSDFKIFSLPVEEVLFFVVVPYALIFVYEVVKFYLGDKEFQINYRLFLFLSIAFLLIASFVYPRTYTTLQMLVTAFLFLIVWITKNKLFSSQTFWLFILISYVPFFVINYFLTSIPIVWYDNTENLGVRVITIPVEDFFYHFAYTSFVLIVYSKLDNTL